MSQPIIEVQNLSKRYRLGRIGATTLRDELARTWRRVKGGEMDDPSGAFWALRDITFNVQPGEVVGIIGRNGAGKSTLLKILSRITEPTSGRAILRGRVASLLEVGTGFHPDLTGRENVYLNGAILGMKTGEIAARFDEITAFSEVEKFMDTPVKHYSSGMRVRLAFAVAAHLDSEILIVDEVLAVGDAAFQDKCLTKMRSLVGQGRTVLFVSHHLQSVQQFCDRAILLKNGTLVTAGPVDAVIDRYLERDTAGPSLDAETHRGPTLTRVEIRGSQVHERSVPAGSDLELLLHARDTTDETRCKFTIYDHWKRPVSHFDQSVDCPEGGAPARHWVCRISPLALLPGNYYINCVLHHHGIDDHHVEGATSFEVVPGEVNGRRALLGHAYGSALLPHTWSSQT